MATLLLPFALLFALAVAIRRGLYRLGVLRVEHLPVPVVVVGNLSVGGSGKTPLVIWLARRLQELGRPAGIVSRGYRAQAGAVTEVSPDADPAVVGDEPLLLRRRAGCPVAVGADRVAAARLLLATHPQLRLILSDDGLQHYRLGRDIEIAVTGTGAELNGWPLPAGPMREGRGRLRQVSAVVAGPGAVPPAPDFGVPAFEMTRSTTRLHALHDTGREIPATALAGMRLHAVAGIAHPQRFFAALEALGLQAEAHVFPDHHCYREADLAFAGDAILTTEKDAVKLERLILPLPVWVLPLDVTVEPDLAQFIVEKLNGRPPA